MGDARTRTTLGPAESFLDAVGNGDGVIYRDEQGLARCLASVALYTFNGISWDRQRGSMDLTLLASTARTATTVSPDQINYNGKSIIVVFDITAVPTIETVTLTIQGKDALSGKYFTILAGAAQVAVTTVTMRVGLGLTAAANLDANGIIPRTFRVNVVHSAAGSFTYSVGASLVI